MRRVLCLWLLLVACRPAGADGRLRIAVDRRVELLSILSRLAGAPEYNRATKGPYVEAVDRHFAPFREHPAVAMTRELRLERGISYNAPPSLAMQLDASFRLSGPLADGVDPRWKGVPVAEYLEQVRDFAEKSDYGGFMASQAGYIAGVEKRFRELLGDKDLVGWFDGLFGRRERATYVLVPGLLTGPMNYGVHAGDQIAEIMNLEAVDADGMPHPGEMTHGLLAHELAHSYVNPVVEARTWDAVARAYDEVHDAMARQAYTKLPIFVDESVVRAVTVLYLRDRAGADAAGRSLAEQERLQFRCTRELADALDGVRKRRDGRVSEGEMVEAARSVLAACHR